MGSLQPIYLIKLIYHKSYLYRPLHPNSKLPIPLPSKPTRPVKQPPQPLHTLLPPSLSLRNPRRSPRLPPPPLRPHNLPIPLRTQLLHHLRHHPFRILPIGNHMPQHHLDTDPLIGAMPAIIIRAHTNEGKGDLGFAEEFRFRHRGHVDAADAERAVEDGFGARAELGAFDADYGS